MKEYSNGGSWSRRKTRRLPHYDKTDESIGAGDGDSFIHARVMKMGSRTMLVNACGTSQLLIVLMVLIQTISCQSIVA